MLWESLLNMQTSFLIIPCVRGSTQFCEYCRILSVCIPGVGTGVLYHSDEEPCDVSRIVLEENEDTEEIEKN